MSQLSAVDATFLNVETATHSAHIAGLGLLDPASCPGGRFTPEAAAELIARRAHLAPRPLKRRLVAVPFGLDHPYWEDDPDFDPARHISEITLPAPGDDEQLARAVALLHERPLERDRPLWEMTIVQGLSGGRAALYVKVHHAAIDGVLAAETIAALLDLSPEPRDVPADDAAPRRGPGPLAMAGTGLLRMATQPVSAALAAARSVPYLDEIPGLGTVPGVGAVARLAQSALGHEEPPPAPAAAPPTPFNRPIGAGRAVAFGSLDLAEVKAVKHALGGSVNDVVMALCASALRTWLDKRGDLPDVPLVAGVPVSLRRAGRASGGDAGNEVTIMTTPLATHVADPASRYAAVRADLTAMKHRFAASAGAWARDIAGMVPPPLAGPLTRLALRAAPATGVLPLNIVVSNVPGPQFPLYLGGAKVLAYYPISVITDLTGGLNITVFSYDGHLDVGIVSCPALVPDPSDLLDHLTDALDELKHLARE